ncbi:hypothetical protein [Fischerella sp. JS2]|uniref:hypothetical protein n=1 Tax=Fischerella sp. JS2 TaxID=2597771 RepID=UPI0028E24C3A|nr:hypothetical protein [Fischerella sp. JS2]
MSHFSVNISNIVLTTEQYRKLKVYAEEQKISVHEAIRLLIDFLPESSKTTKNLDNKHPFIFSRRFLQTFFDIQ